MDLLDVHTHNPDALRAVISVRPWQFAPKPGKVYSVGIHPWDVAGLGGCEMETLRAVAADCAVVAIGECGIDKLRGGDLKTQVAVTEAHIELSERLGKPLIIHCVRAVNEIVALHRRFRPRQQWVIHGFRGSAGAARSLLACEGVNLSFGERFPAAAVEVTPVSRLYVETDESSLPIEEIAAPIAALKGCPVEALRAGRLLGL